MGKDTLVRGRRINYRSLWMRSTLGEWISSKLGKAKEKARLDTRKDMLKGLEKSGDKNAQYNADRYMSNFKGVNNKSLYPSPIPKV